MAANGGYNKQPMAFRVINLRGKASSLTIMEANDTTESIIAVNLLCRVC